MLVGASLSAFVIAVKKTISNVEMLIQDILDGVF